MAAAKKKNKPERVDDKNAFVDGVRHGVLIHRGIKLFVNGEFVWAQPGDIVVPSEADLVDPQNPRSFVATVALHCRGLRDGRPKGGRSASVYKSKAALNTAAKLVRKRIMDQNATEAMNAVEDGLAQMGSQGRSITSMAALDRLLERQLGYRFDSVIYDTIRNGLAEEYKLVKPAGQEESDASPVS